MRIDNRRHLHQACLNLVSHDIYSFLVNAANTVRGRRFRISPVHEEHVFLADDGESRIFFCRRRNGRRFRRGVMRRVDRLASAYHLDAIDVLPGGTFIDCGANIGELGLWARKHGLSYVAFEPETLEARCCDLNNFGGHPETERKALWKETATLSFHSKPETSDGSVFDMGDPVSRVDVSAVTLDDAVDLPAGSGGNRHFQGRGRGCGARGAGRRQQDTLVGRLGGDRLRLRAGQGAGPHLRRNERLSARLRFPPSSRRSQARHDALHERDASVTRLESGRGGREGSIHATTPA